VCSGNIIRVLCILCCVCWGIVCLFVLCVSTRYISIEIHNKYICTICIPTYIYRRKIGAQYEKGAHLLVSNES
jgi:hypothetical protein